MRGDGKDSAKTDAIHSNKIQENPAQYDLLRGSLTVGFSYSDLINFGCIGAMVSYHPISNYSILTVRYIRGSNYNGSDNVLFNNVGLLYGIGGRGEVVSEEIDAGIEYVYLMNQPYVYDSLTIRYNLSQKNYSSSIGVIGQVQVLFMPTANFGIGFMVYKDYSKILSQTGILLCIEFGIL